MTYAQTSLTITAENLLNNARVSLREGDTLEAYNQAQNAVDVLDGILSLECFEEA